MWLSLNLHTMSLKSCCQDQPRSRTPKHSMFVVTLALLAVFGSVIYLSCAKDACSTVNCLNLGTCSGGSCTCPTGWTGTFCETSAFAGNWSGTDACDSTQRYNFSIAIDANSTDTTKFIIRNPHGYATWVSGKRSGATSINIASQSCDAYLLSGTLTLSDNNNLAFTYTLTDTGGAHAVTQCSGKYSR